MCFVLPIDLVIFISPAFKAAKNRLQTILALVTFNPGFKFD
jgi:hypothetical protein